MRNQELRGSGVWRQESLGKHQARGLSPGGETHPARLRPTPRCGDRVQCRCAEACQRAGVPETMVMPVPVTLGSPFSGRLGFAGGRRPLHTSRAEGSSSSRSQRSRSPVIPSRTNSPTQVWPKRHHHHHHHHAQGQSSTPGGHLMQRWKPALVTQGQVRRPVIRRGREKWCPSAEAT